jgi:hypothetical protein
MRSCRIGHAVPVSRDGRGVASIALNAFNDRRHPRRSRSAVSPSIDTAVHYSLPAWRTNTSAGCGGNTSRTT